MAGEGQILRDAREKKGWSLQDAEEVTKIRTRYLEALEAEDYSVLPGSTYAKGFLRTYAKNLGLDSNEVLAFYKSSMSDSTPNLEPPLTPMRSRPLWLKPAVAALMALAAIGLVIGIAHWSRAPGNQTAADYSPSPLPSAPKAEAPKDQNSAAPQTNAAQSTASNSAATTPPASTTPNTDVLAATTDGLDAQLVFTQPCWLVVQTDGQTALQGTFAAGTSKELKASTKIELVTVGNAGGVSITLNGKALPSLGASGQVVRNVILTKDNLKAQ